MFTAEGQCLQHYGNVTSLFYLLFPHTCDEFSEVITAPQDRSRVKRIRLSHRPADHLFNILVFESVMTAATVVSDPVPEVVGIATKWQQKNRLPDRSRSFFLGIIWKMLYGGFRVIPLFSVIITPFYDEFVTFMRTLFVYSLSKPNFCRIYSIFTGFSLEKHASYPYFKPDNDQDNAAKDRCFDCENSPQSASDPKPRHADHESHRSDHQC